MTESGNHGGSSYEETDSLALFIGMKNNISDDFLSTHNIVHQVIYILNCLFTVFYDYLNWNGLP